jgi:hypothetical protein
MPARYTLRCPTREAHRRAKELIPRYGRLVVDNERRLSLSAEFDDPKLVEELKKLGIEVFPDQRYDHESS